MRIVLIGTSYPMRGGMAHYIARLHEELQKRGHESKIFSLKRQYPSFLFPGKTQHDFSAEGVVVPSEPTLDTINPISWIRTAWKIRRHHPDVVVFNYWMPFFLPSYASVAFLVKRLCGAKVVFICHNIIPHERRPGDRILTRIGLRVVDGFVVHSSDVLGDLKRFTVNPDYRHIPLPLFEMFRGSISRDAARERLGLTSDDRVLLFFGYVRRYKGLHILLGAASRLRTRLPVRVLIAGEFYEDVAQTMRSVRELDLESDVKIHNKYIPNEDVATYFMASDVVVLPYLTATQSGILQIAYNYDKPVIVTDAGGLAESVSIEETGLVTPSGNEEALAQSIMRFYDLARTVDFRANVRNYKLRFSWMRVARAIEELCT